MSSQAVSRAIPEDLDRWPDAAPRRARARQPAAAWEDDAGARRAEARRRMRLIRRRRLDLLQDTGLALLLAVVVLVFTAGLGVVALLALPVALLLVGSLVVERRRRGLQAGERRFGP